MSFDFLLDVATRIGVGVERSAAGYDDTPLQDLVTMVDQWFGPPAADAVDWAFGTLIDTLGPDLLADVPVTMLPPVFDVNNGRSDFYVADIPIGPYILDIGSPENVGDGELARIVLGFVDGDDDDSDVQQILSELTTGDSGAELDFEFVPGINGVWLSELSMSHYAIGIADGGATDTLVFRGPGTEAAIWSLDSPANLMDDQSRLSLVEVGAEEVKLGYLFQNPIKDLVGDELDSAEDIRALMDAAEAGDARVDMISQDDDYVSMRIYNGLRNTWDTFVFYGDEVEKALGEDYVTHEPEPEPERPHDVHIDLFG